MASRSSRESKLGIKRSGNKCIVCDWAIGTKDGILLVEGAHVRDFKGAPEYDKYSNIIALCPNHHAEFDAYNFYIDADTKSLIFNYDSPFSGKNVEENIKHIEKRHLLYRKAQFDKYNQNNK